MKFLIKKKNLKNKTLIITINIYNFFLDLPDFLENTKELLKIVLVSINDMYF